MEVNSLKETAKRFSKAAKYAWIAFLPPFGYGFLESSLDGSFPVCVAYELVCIVEFISLLLTSFAVGAIVFQLPLGILSDKFRRKLVLGWILSIGAVTFFTASLLEETAIPLVACLFIAGMVVGSTFSLGISYMTDLIPARLLPTGNLLCGIAFSIGSLAGPYIGGTFIQFFHYISFFNIISGMLGFIFYYSFCIRTKDA